MSAAKHTCCEKVSPAGSYRSYPCKNTAKVERDGKHYCGVHDPVSLAAKRDQRHAELMAKHKARQSHYAQVEAKRKEQEHRAACFPELLEALQEVVTWLEIGDHESEMHTKARAAIAKATGEA